jgi:predicted nucleic acid-binding Zn ribbon protein
MSSDKVLKEAIEEWVELLKNKRGYYEGKAVSLWKTIVGPQIASETETVYIKNRVMFVKIKSGSLKHELEFARKKLVQNINKETDYNVIDEIYFL